MNDDASLPTSESPQEMPSCHIVPVLHRVFCQEQRTQAQNRERAFAILRAKLFELELQKQQDEIYAARKSQVCNRDTTGIVMWNIQELSLCRRAIA